MLRRREVLIGTGLSLLSAASRGRLKAEVAATLPADMDPAGGFTGTNPNTFLFTDFRHVRPGDISWRSPDGKPLPVAGPPDPPVEAVADLGSVARGIRLVAEPARKEGPLDGVPGRVLHDGSIYRSWSLRVDYGEGRNLGSYSVAPARALSVRYGESRDGYAWEWRDAGEVRVSGITGIDGEDFFIDPHGPPEERYKAIYHAAVLDGTGELWRAYQQLHPRHRDTRLGPERMNCLFGLVSPDGIHWKQLPKPLLIHKGDTDNTVYWDSWLGKYVLYTRLYWLDRRLVARSESHDFRNWAPVEPVVWPGLEQPASFDVYTNARTAYPGLPGQHLMFPFYYRRYTQGSEIHMLSSIDGIHWDRVPGGPVLEPGPPGGWDGEFVVAGKGLVPLGKDRVAIPYSGVTHPHKYPRWPGVISGRTGWAWWPTGRMASLTADEEGEFHTFPTVVTGSTLRINASVRRAGYIRVGLSGIEGRSAGDCDAVLGDHLAHTVTWKGERSLRVAPNSTVALHFRLRSAQLFGFEWA